MQLEAGSTEPIHFQHAAAEAMNLPDASQNLVSACLLFHELPQSAAQNIVKEAFRILKPGGVLSVMVSPAVNKDLSCVMFQVFNMLASACAMSRRTACDVITGAHSNYNSRQHSTATQVTYALSSKQRRKRKPEAQ